MNPYDQQKPIAGIKHIITIGSGKGGVGKSTVSANLALALRKQGKKVGLLDADIYGPSIPRMFGAINQPPVVDDTQKIEPITRLGIKLMSIGFMVAENASVVWRGPMLFKAMDQFFRDVKWGELDFLIIDLPPGTGDIPLTIAQKVPVSGGIAVTTPQNLALIDAKKAIDMFERINIPLLGVVENMSSFTPPGSSQPIDLFPRGEIDQYLDSLKIENLCKIPFNQSIALGSEMGIPFLETQLESPEAQAYVSLGKKIISQFPN